MCNSACLGFVARTVGDRDVRNKRILEVGARDVNGSARSYLEAMKPMTYLGIDIDAGEGVDEICAVEKVALRYGTGSFDLVVSTEVLEHLLDWRAGVNNMKRVLAPEGLLLLTTRSFGFPLHGYPWDFWRYETDDVREIFADFHVLRVESDPIEPGVFMFARKPPAWRERDLSQIELYSIVNGRRVRVLSMYNRLAYTILYSIRKGYVLLLPSSVRDPIQRVRRWISSFRSVRQ
jgi:SAM-dependent methyltransferase